MERGLLQGLAAFRWAAWLWMAATLVIARGDRLVDVIGERFE